MCSNRLQLNTAKTEILWSTTGRRVHLLPKSPLRVGTGELMPASVVRDLGIYIDSDVSMRSHVAKTVCACFAALRQLRSVRRSVRRPVLQSLMSSLVLSWLDYGNGSLVGIPLYQLERLLSVLMIHGFSGCLCCICLLYTSPSPRDGLLSRMPSSA